MATGPPTFGGCNYGKLEGLLLGYSLVSTDSKVIGSVKGIIMGSRDGKVIGAILVDADLITRGLDVGTYLGSLYGSLMLLII